MRLIYEQRIYKTLSSTKYKSTAKPLLCIIQVLQIVQKALDLSCALGQFLKESTVGQDSMSCGSAIRKCGENYLLPQVCLDFCSMRYAGGD